MILINLVPVNSGGGLQNAISFLRGLNHSQRLRSRSVVVCTVGSVIEQACMDMGLTYFGVRGGWLGRLKFEVWGGRAIAARCRARIIFSLFGGAPVNAGAAYTISGFAYSNIIQREVPFWSFLPIWQRLGKWVKDELRLYLARRSDELVLETEYLCERARDGVFRRQRLHLVNMEPSAAVRGRAFLPVSALPASPVDILYLAGAHPNKRIHLLAPVFKELKRLGMRARLITTMPQDAPYAKKVTAAFSNEGIADFLVNVGPVHPGDVADLLERSHAVINVAMLESFSNNWVEAWESSRPLISTDADWARRSCGDSAIYVDIHDPKAAAGAIRAGLANSERFIMAGRLRLADLAIRGPKIVQYEKILLRRLGELRK